MEEVRRSGRARGKQPYVEENTIDDPIDADVENSDDDFEPQVYQKHEKPVSLSDRTPVKKWTRTEIMFLKQRVPNITPKKIVADFNKGKKRVAVNDGKKNNKKHKGEKANEDDFASPSRITRSSPQAVLGSPSRVTRSSPQAAVAGPSNKSEKKNTDISTTLRTRSSPHPLYLAIATLKANQQACVASLGFGNLLQFKVDGIPSKLGFYVINNFDGDKMEIKLGKGSLDVNLEVISDMLGLKNEGDNIMMAEVTGNEGMYREWKKQYPMDEGKITPSVVKGMIRRSKAVDLNFKLNFIVLFANIMGCCKKTGSCDLEILKHISHDTKFDNINWCQFVLDSLPECKEGWKPKVKNNYFCGPVTLLTMIYVDGTKCESLPIVRHRPPTSKWSMDLLREREEAELETGGCGLGDKEPPYVEEEDYGFPEEIEGFIWKLGKYIETIRKARSCFEKTLVLGMGVFPENEELKKLEKRYEEGLRLIDGGNVGNVDLRTPHIEKGIGQASGSFTGGGGFDTPHYHFGEQTQAIVIATADKVTSAALKGKALEKDGVPSCSLSLTQGFEEIKSASKEKGSANNTNTFAAVPVSFCRPSVTKNVKDNKREKREQQAPESKRSPFVVRAVDLSACNPEEKKANKVLLEMAGDPDEILFKTIGGLSSTRMMMESLGQSQHVRPNVINAWGAILNIGERNRSPHSPLRYYMPTFLVTEGFRNALFEADKRSQMFNEYVEEAIRKDGKTRELKGVDLVFIPVSNGEHNFLVVFNLKKCDIWMLDSKGREKNFVKKGKKKVFLTAKKVIDGEETVADDSVATIVHADFGRYLTNVGHPKAMDIFTGKLKVPHLKWQTDSKVPNSGIVVMRHMETYMGEITDKYDCGLSDDARKQIAQLNKLRMKYAARILLHGSNLMKDKIRGMMASI